mmetsp:Transcript_25759/g.43410  ORF Transcript_25759/g.43410 Transcript_25759/m.43410 type:complete len:378 (-) Transcript_25759:120-1253(-)
MAELSDKYVKTSESKELGQGVFRKQGEVLKLWKVRNYKMFKDGILITLDPSKNSTTNIYNLTGTSFTDLDEKYVDKAGAPRNGVALSVVCVTFGQLDLVLDSQKEAEAFVMHVGQVSLSNALAALSFAKARGWTECANLLEDEVDRLEEEEEFEHEFSDDEEDEEGDSDDDSVDDMEHLSLKSSGSVTNATTSGHSTNVLHSAAGDTFTDSKNSIVCAGKFLMQNSFKKSCHIDDWKPRQFSLNKNGILTYVNRMGFDTSLDVTGCMLTYIEVGITDRVDVVLALEISVAKSSKKTKCIVFDAENKENNLKQMDDFVNLMQKSFKVIIMNQSVRGKKVKKEKEVVVEVALEDYSATFMLLVSVTLFCSGLFFFDNYI